MMSHLAGRESVLHRLVDKRPRLDLQALAAVEGVLIHPPFIAAAAVSPELDPRHRRWVGDMIESGPQARRIRAESAAVGIAPEEARHTSDIGLPPRTVGPVHRAQLAIVDEHVALREMELRIVLSRHPGIRPRHPRMRSLARIVKNRPLR